MKTNIQSPIAGFTLIEVLVALVIVAVSLAALSRLVGQTINHTAYLDEKVIATWVAENRAAELELHPDDIETGKKKGSEKMAAKEWYWEQRIEDTEDPDLKRVEIDVSNKEYSKVSPLVTLVTLANLKVSNAGNDL